MCDQQRIEQLRNYAGRCPKCGSKDTAPADYVWNQNMDEELGIGVSCEACGYWNDMWSADDSWVEDRSYIAPGDSGSHDQPDDYSGECD